jgi:hypothetical protein
MSRCTQRTCGAVRPACFAAAKIASFTEARGERAPIAILEVPERAKERVMARPIPRDAPAMKMDLFVAGWARGEISG